MAIDQKNHSITEGVQPNVIDQYGVELNGPIHFNKKKSSTGGGSGHGNYVGNKLNLN